MGLDCQHCGFASILDLGASNEGFARLVAAGSSPNSFYWNFSTERGKFNPCQKVWCGSCYTAPLGSPYPIRKAQDEDGFEVIADGDELRFKCARNGDFLMTPFQCDLCHFRNIQMRDPRPRKIEDIRLMKDIRHANLNAFWARESSTVAANLSQALKLENIGRDFFGMKAVTPAMGPFPLEDTFGMRIAVCLLKRSLDPGRNEKHIQFSTARKLRSAFSNAYHASKEVGNVASMAYESTKTYATTCPTYGYWFERFILGCHKRMGDFLVTDFALSKEIFVELVDHLDYDYGRCDTDGEKDKVVEFANVLIMGYVNGLRGEEIMKIDAAGLLKYLDTGAQHQKFPHVIVALVGRLKGETGERYHMIPMARVTRTGIPCGKWADRLGTSLIEDLLTGGGLESSMSS